MYIRVHPHMKLRRNGFRVSVFVSHAEIVFQNTPRVLATASVHNIAKYARNNEEGNAALKHIPIPRRYDAGGRFCHLLASAHYLRAFSTPSQDILIVNPVINAVVSSSPLVLFLLIAVIVMVLVSYCAIVNAFFLLSTRPTAGAAGDRRHRSVADVGHQQQGPGETELKRAHQSQHGHETSRDNRRE